MNLVPLTPEERFSLTERASTWGGPLTTEQFMERNRRLYAHPYGKKAIQSFAWKDARGTILSSMDCLSVTVLTGGRGKKITESPAGLIASVITPPAVRGRGFASRMLEAFFDLNPAQPYVLYSDIGSAFYRRYQFVPQPVFSVTAKTEGTYAEATPLSLSEFTQALRHERHRMVGSSSEPVLVLWPDETLIDWHLERFRYFAEVSKKTWPKTNFWKTASHALVAAVPHFLQGRLEVLWGFPTPEKYLPCVRALASQYGLTHIHYWADVGDGKPEWPMFRLSEAGAIWRDIQLLDWW